MHFVNKLVWDEWNVAHIARHGVSQTEVEEVCQADPMLSQTYNDRLRVVGSTKAGRILTLILAPRDEGVYYPVTARSASRKERKRYQLQKEVNS